MNTIQTAYAKKTLEITIARLWPDRPKLGDHPYLIIRRSNKKFVLRINHGILMGATNREPLPPYDPSRTVGTYPNSDASGWRVRRARGGKLVNLGQYRTREEAAIAYQLVENGEVEGKPTLEQVTCKLAEILEPTIEEGDCF